MLRLTILLLLAGLNFSASATSIDVGGRQIDVPVPDGFVELTPAIPSLYDAMTARVGPNIRFITFIRAADAEAMLRGGPIEFERYLTVAVDKNLDGKSISTDNFKELREQHASQLEQAIATTGEDRDNVLGDTLDKLGIPHRGDIEVFVNPVVPLPIHLDTTDRFAYSGHLNVETSVASEPSRHNTYTSTTLVLHVLDRFLILHVYGSDSDLDWTRTQASRLADAIVAANPIFGGISNWEKSVESSLIGAVSAGVLALLAFLFWKNKRRDKD